MNKIYETKYDLYSNNNFNICILSDIHMSSTIENEKLDKILKYIEKEHPKYILIPGDLIDRVQEIDTEKERLFKWLKKLAIISKIFIVLGNHDVSKKRKSYCKPNKFINEINKLNNIKILDNELYEDENIYLYGLTQSYDNYEIESPKILLEDIKKVPCKKTDKIKIIMMHSPESINSDVLKKLEDYDYIICGHMHNGCVPVFLDKIWRSTRGLITPTKKLLKKNERNTLKKVGDKLLVCGPITTFQKVAGLFQLFNIFYPVYVTQMVFKNNQSLKSKIVIKKEYKLTKNDN